MAVVRLASQPTVSPPGGARQREHEHDHEHVARAAAAAAAALTIALVVAAVELAADERPRRRRRRRADRALLVVRQRVAEEAAVAAVRRHEERAVRVRVARALVVLAAGLVQRVEDRVVRRGLVAVDAALEHGDGVAERHDAQRRQRARRGGATVAHQVGRERGGAEGDERDEAQRGDHFVALARAAAVLLEQQQRRRRCQIANLALERSSFLTVCVSSPRCLRIFLQHRIMRMPSRPAPRSHRPERGALRRARVRTSARNRFPFFFLITALEPAFRCSGTQPVAILRTRFTRLLAAGFDAKRGKMAPSFPLPAVYKAAHGSTASSSTVVRSGSRATACSLWPCQPSSEARRCTGSPSTPTS